MNIDILNKRAAEMVLLLSSSYQTQIASFPEFVNIPDEIAFETEEIVNLLSRKKKRNELLYSTLKKADQVFDKIDDKDFWTLEAMKNDKIWENIRVEAKSIVNRVVLAHRKPDLFWLTFMVAKKSDESSESQGRH